jgi:hypothetical protein
MEPRLASNDRTRTWGTGTFIAPFSCSAHNLINIVNESWFSFENDGDATPIEKTSDLY